MNIFFLVTLLALLLAWLFYPLCIILLSQIIRPPKRCIGKKNRIPKTITIVIAAYNEAETILPRIKNILELESEFKVDVIVASDGSEDETVHAVNSLNLDNVVAIDYQPNRGRAAVHNEAVRCAKGDILLFTDTESRFEKDFLNKIMVHFENSNVGVAVGRIIYRNEDASSIGKSSGLYWKYEEAIRKAEDTLGVLAFGTGAALAMRRKLYSPIGLTEDIDYAETLAVREKGYYVAYEPKAICYDYINETEKGAFKTRIRQTSRSFKSIISRILSPSFACRFPFAFIAAFFHKTMRHLTPFLMVAAFMSNSIVLRDSYLFIVIFTLQLFFYLLSILGYIAIHNNIKVYTLLLLPYNFILLNLSRGIGVIYALRGLEEASYHTQR